MWKDEGITSTKGGGLMSMGMHMGDMDMSMSMSIGIGGGATWKGQELRRGKSTGREIDGVATSLLFNLHLFMFKHPMSMGIWQAHTGMRIWAWGYMIACTHGVGLTWEINSYAQVQRAKTA